MGMPLNVFLFILVFLNGSSAQAKQTAAAPVTPIVHAGLRYEAPRWAYEDKEMKHNGGYVRIVNTANGLPVCTRQVYDVTYDKSLETDVQDNFIISLSIEGPDLVVASEKLPPIRIPLAGFCDEKPKSLRVPEPD